MPPPATTPPRSALDSLWTPQALVAIVLAGEGLAAVLALASEPQDRWVQFGLLSLLVQWISLAALGALYLLRRPLSGLPPPALARVCLGLLLVTAYLVAVVARATFTDTTGVAPDHGFVARLLGITLVVGLFALVAFQNYYDSRRAALRAKHAELEALQARLRPHFLFNALNSAATLVHGRPRDAERVLLDMSDLFRAALSKPGWVALDHEVDLCGRYLAIERARFGDRLRVDWVMGPATDGLQIPLLSLQPLVENAVAHGLDPSDGSKSLRIEIGTTREALVVEVSNPLPGDNDVAAHHGHRIGLAGVRAKLEAISNGAATLTTRVDAGRFTACVTVPLAAMPRPDQASTR